MVSKDKLLAARYEESLMELQDLQGRFPCVFHTGIVTKKKPKVLTEIPESKYLYSLFIGDPIIMHHRNYSSHECAGHQLQSKAS